MSRRFPSHPPKFVSLEADADKIARLEEENARLKADVAAKDADIARLNRLLSDGSAMRAPTEEEILAALKAALAGVASAASAPKPAPSPRKSKG